jgi:hypothetical protein
MAQRFAADLAALLGLRIDDPAVTEFLHGVDPATKVIRTDEDEPRWISKQAGMVVYADGESARITTVFLYSEGHQGASQYRGPLPHGLDFSMSKAQVQASVPRPPDFTSDEHDTWDFDDHRLVVRYGRTGTISRATVTGAF